jgi:hypothetical protein
MPPSRGGVLFRKGLTHTRRTNVARTLALVLWSRDISLGPGYTLQAEVNMAACSAWETEGAGTPPTQYGDAP